MTQWQLKLLKITLGKTEISRLERLLWCCQTPAVCAYISKGCCLARLYPQPKAPKYPLTRKWGSHGHCNHCCSNGPGFYSYDAHFDYPPLLSTSFVVLGWILCEIPEHAHHDYPLNLKSVSTIYIDTSDWCYINMHTIYNYTLQTDHSCIFQMWTWPKDTNTPMSAIIEVSLVPSAAQIIQEDRSDPTTKYSTVDIDSCCICKVNAVCEHNIFNMTTSNTSSK